MSNNDFLKFASREEVSASVKLDGLSLQYASDELKSDREIVLAAVAQNCYALQYASDGLRADREIVLTAVTKTADSLKYASDELKSDREIISVANGISNGLTLEITRYTEKSLRSSKPYMLVELRKKGSSLEYASDELKSDREIVLAAVTQNGYALQHASAELRANREIVLAAVKQNGGTLKYASDQLCEDKELVSLSISNGLGLEVNASTKQSLRNSKLYMMEAVRNNDGALEYASDELKSDREFILTAVKQNGGALKYASDKLKADKQIILEALNRDSSVLTYVNWNNESIAQDKDFLKEIAIRHTDKIYLIEKNIIADFDLLLSIANESKEVLTFFDGLKSNQKFWYWLIQNDCTFFDVIPHTYKKSIEFIIEVYRQSPNLFWRSNLNEIISKPNVIDKLCRLHKETNFIKPTAKEVIEEMNQVQKAIDYINTEMEKNYLYVDDYYQEKFADIISEEKFNSLKINFISNWCDKTFPEKSDDYNEYKKLKVDEQQALAIGSVSKNTKVTARAGSGKTATLVLRAIFLNLHCNVNWDHMLIMAFNTNAADEINKRINKYLKIINPKNPKNNISVASTFHAFAEGVVKEPYKDLLLITEEKSSSDGNYADKSPQDIIHGIFQTKIKSVHENLTKVKNVIFEHLTHFNDDVVDDTQAELLKKSVSDPIAEKNLIGLNGWSYKTNEDRLVANWLVCCGIKFSYKKRCKTNNKSSTKEVSFVLDAKNQNKKYIIDSNLSENRHIFNTQLKDNYELIDLDMDHIKSIMAKFVNSLDCPACTTRVFCPGIDFCSGTHTNVGLEKVCVLCSTVQKTSCCKRCEEHCVCIPMTSGIPAKFKTNEEIWGELRDKLLDDFQKAIKKFIDKCRALWFSPEKLAEKSEVFEFKPLYTKYFVEIALVVYQSYMDELNKQQLRDFTLTVDLAIKELKDGKTKYSNGKRDVRDLRFIFIDEYQDFSILFHALVDGIISNNPKLLVFCVGDDWQAINGFAGSDLKFFTNFNDYFKDPLELNMLRNYRSNKNIVEAANLVMFDEGAAGVPALKDNGNIYFVESNDLQPLNSKEETYFGNDKVSAYVYRIIQKILDNGQSVSILSRNNTPRVASLKLENKKIDNFVDNLKKFFNSVSDISEENGKIKLSKDLIQKGSTVHSYKGQESKAIILLAPYVFPSIHPDWVFYQILGESLEKIKESERRLFYVAITRAKQDLYLIGDLGKSLSNPFLEQNVWRENGLISTLNKEDYPAFEKFPAQNIHVEIQTPQEFGSSVHSKLRDELFKNERCKFTWSESQKVWAKNFPITNIKVDNGKEQSLYEWLDVCNKALKNYGLDLNISASYSDMKLFTSKSIVQQLKVIKKGVFYFMNLMSVEDTKTLITKIEMTGKQEFLSIKNFENESFLFYLVNNNWSKFDEVTKRLNVSEDKINEKNNQGSTGLNILNKALSIGDFETAKNLIALYPKLLNKDTEYKSKNIEIVQYLCEQGYQCKEEDVALAYFKRIKSDKAELLEHLARFINYKLPLDNLIKIVLLADNIEEQYLLLKQIILVSSQDDVNSLVKTEYYQNELNEEFKSFIDSYHLNDDALKINSDMQSRMINRLVHFTNTRNLESIFQTKGLYSIHRLREKEKNYIASDLKRLDGLHDYICCSITNINKYYFDSCQKRNPIDDYCVLVLDARLIYKHESLYSISNVAKERNNNELQITASTFEYFNKLFADSLTIDNRFIRRKATLNDNETTDPQAEVLIHNNIHYFDIKEIIVKNERIKASCENILKENKITWISVVVNDVLFNVKPEDIHEEIKLDTAINENNNVPF